MNPEHSCNCIFSMVNDSFLCNHYHFMKMSNSDRFKECFWHKRPKNHDFTPGFGAKMQFTQPKCTPNTHETILFYWLIIVLHAITIPSWKWMIYMILKGAFCKNTPENQDFTPGFGAKMQFNLPKCTPHSHVMASFHWWMTVLHAITIPSWKWVIYMILKGVFCKNTPKNHDFTPGFGAKMQFNLPKCTPNTHETISFYWWIIVLHAITILSWKWVI